MGYTSILITPDTTIRPIYESQSGAKIDWLSCRYATRSQPVATSAATNYDTPPHLGYGSAANIPDEARNSPHLILYFRFQGSWIEWGRAPLRASGRADWGLLDLKRYFSDSDLSLGPGAAIGCNLTYDSASDDCMVIGGVSYDDPAATASGGDIPPGTILWFGGSLAPSGWLTLNGAAWLRSLYPELWSFAQAEIAAGNQFYNAGNGSTTFGARDCRGEFFRAWDNGRGVDSGRGIGSYAPSDFKSFSLTNSHAGQSYTHGPLLIPKSGSQSLPVFGGGWSAPAGGIFIEWDTTEPKPRSVALLPIIKF